MCAWIEKLTLDYFDLMKEVEFHPSGLVFVMLFFFFYSLLAGAFKDPPAYEIGQLAAKHQHI